MKKGINILILILSFMLFSGQQVRAAATEWEFDPVHSRFYFEIDHTYASVIGFFEDFSGTFLFSTDNLEESRIYFEIKTKSINTNVRKRDNHLRSDDFFSVKKYPVIIFESRAIKHVGTNQYSVEGKLTIKDVTKDIMLPLTFLGMKENPLEPKQIVAGFESRLTINRLDYHVGKGKFYDMGVVGKDVNITVSLEMLRKK